MENLTLQSNHEPSLDITTDDGIKTLSRCVLTLASGGITNKAGCAVNNSEICFLADTAKGPCESYCGTISGGGLVQIDAMQGTFAARSVVIET